MMNPAADTASSFRPWAESRLLLPEVLSASRPEAHPSGTGHPEIWIPETADLLSNFCLAGLLLLFFFLAYRRIRDGIIYTAASCFQLKKLLTIEHQLNIQNCRDTLFFFSILLSSFIITQLDTRSAFLPERYPAYLKFILILAGSGAYLLFKRGTASLLGWINRNSVFTTIYKIGYTYAILGLALFSAGFLATIVFPGIPIRCLAIYGAGCACIMGLLYFVRGYQLIIANQFSHFFWILYLCTFELLPIILVVHIIVP